MDCFNKFLKGIRQVPLHAQVVDYNYLTPENLIKIGQIPSKQDPAFVHFGSGTAHQDEAEIKQRVIEQRYALEAHAIRGHAIRGHNSGSGLQTYNELTS
jgi:hypothetical protein